MKYLMYEYCPKCGGRNVDEAERRVGCDDCGFVFYLNAAAAVAGLIYDDEKLLMVVRAHDPQKGKLDLPGGFVDFNETAEEALQREIREELNLEITDLTYICTQPNTYLYKGMEYQVLDIFYRCRAVDLSQVRPADDVADYVMMALAGIDVDSLAFASTKKMIGRIK